MFLTSLSICVSLWTHSFLNLPYNPLPLFSFGRSNLANGSHFKRVHVLSMSSSVFEPLLFETANILQALCTFPLNWHQMFFQGTLVPLRGMVFQNQDLGVRCTNYYWGFIASSLWQWRETGSLLHTQTHRVLNN